MQRFAWLQQHWYNPRVILDIGANTGEWTHSILRIFPNARVKLFEANPNCAADLRQRFSECEIFIGLLGNENKPDVLFYIDPYNPKGTGCSIMKELTTQYKYATPVMLQMHSLDDLVADRAEIIKIDVQGAEKLVLEGGLKTLQRADFVLMELNVLQYNEGAPMLAEMVAYMEEKGFQVFDCVEHHQHMGYCIQLDFIFINKRSKVFPTLTLDGVEFKNTEEL